MTYSVSIITTIFQFIVGYLFLFFGTWVGLGSLLNALGLVSPETPNPWWNTPLTFISFVLTASLGVWLVGFLVARIRNVDFNKGKMWWNTFAGSAFGIIIVTVFYLILGAVGFVPMLIAVIGAMLGYHLLPKARN